MSGFDYNAQMTAITNALKTYNTTTSTPYLSQSLTSRVVNSSILIGDPERTRIRGYDYPVIYVQCSKKAEEYDSLGAPGPSGSFKRATVNYSIFGIYQKDGAASARDALFGEVYNLARNIEAIFQAEHRLSNTALWCNPAETEFSPLLSSEGTWTKAVFINLEVENKFR